ncbi:hypothetical protein F0344_03450 [Streptomyces finlayi]|uniref:Uncharacterized protein n=1 Tax=Streptomyces finlayi TaxID=67296 RepID=A0A7G7BEM1_9ACTN|nr:hypothetical protein [Streptomyces finlayi]QNE73786.1 hypothetical protein F0344_03450 [Streptomyces finlayi]
MDKKIQLISDGDGITVLGSQKDVEHFLASERLLSLATEISGRRLGALLRFGAAVAQTGSEMSANSACWLKLTKESARLVKEHGLMETGTPGVSHVMVGQPGLIKSWLQAEKGAGSFLVNPANLAGVAGIMAQLSRQQEMSEIKSYLATIDKKIDDVIRAQEDVELGKVVGAGFDIESAMTVLRLEGRVDDDTWSTVQARTHTITDALGWALRRLDALAKRMESATKVGDLAESAREVDAKLQDLLPVVARCYELQNALDLLRLERVLYESPDKLDGRRLALKEDRQRRRELISEAVEHLMARMDTAADTARSNVLLHLSVHRAVVASVNQAGKTVDDFHRPLGIESGRRSTEGTRWWDAAKDAKQLKNAAAEAGRKAAAAGVGVAVVAVGVLAIRAAQSSEQEGGEESE